MHDVQHTCTSERWLAKACTCPKCLARTRKCLPGLARACKGAQGRARARKDFPRLARQLLHALAHLTVSQRQHEANDAKSASRSSAGNCAASGSE
eukprot:4854812-Alexandrium_andersonii.AAC.1